MVTNERICMKIHWGKTARLRPYYDHSVQERREGLEAFQTLSWHGGQIPLGPFCHFCSSCLKVLSTKKKLNNHIVEIHKDPITFVCHPQPCPVFQNSPTTVAGTCQESPAYLNTYWWFMQPASLQKYWKTDTWPSRWHIEGSALPSATSTPRQESALRSTWR